MPGQAWKIYTTKVGGLGITERRPRITEVCPGTKDISNNAVILGTSELAQSRLCLFFGVCVVKFYKKEMYVSVCINHNI